MHATVTVCHSATPGRARAVRWRHPPGVLDGERCAWRPPGRGARSSHPHRSSRRRPMGEASRNAPCNDADDPARAKRNRMRIEAHIDNEHQRHAVELRTNGVRHSLSVMPRPNGFGSSANGGELLCLALATCYCNDIYREAEKRDIVVLRVRVDVEAEFGATGEPARSLRYRANVAARASESEILDLMLHTDRVAEVQNTLRRGMDVRFDAPVAESAGTVDTPTRR